MNLVMLTSALNGIMVDGLFVMNENIDEMTFECERCGERHLFNNSRTVDGEIWCEECWDEDSFECGRCGERHCVDNAHSVETRYGTEWWCDFCYDNYTVRCEHCDADVDEDYATDATGDGDWVCDDCLDNYYAQCARCGEWHEILTVVRDDGWVCDFCRDAHYTWDEDSHEWVSNEEIDRIRAERERINAGYADALDDAEDSNEGARSSNAVVRGYHSRPSWWNQFVGARNALDNTAYMGIGVELEVDVKSGESSGYMQRALNRIDRIAGDRVYFNHDCSLRDGFEIISRPHTPEAFSEMPWAEIMDACKENGFSSHDAETCGLHFHFSRLMFGDDEETQDDNISKLVQFFEFYWDDIVKVSRREGNQLRWCNKKGYVSKKRIKEYVKEKWGGHDEAINNANPHTVEVRIMRGTLNIDTFNASIDFLTTLIKNACRIGWDEVSEADEMLKGIKPETADYLMRRNAFYNEAHRIRYSR